MYRNLLFTGLCSIWVDDNIFIHIITHLWTHDVFLYNEWQLSQFSISIQIIWSLAASVFFRYRRIFSTIRSGFNALLFLFHIQFCMIRYTMDFPFFSVLMSFYNNFFKIMFNISIPIHSIPLLGERTSQEGVRSIQDVLTSTMWKKTQMSM